MKYLIVIAILVGLQACDPDECLDPSNICEWYITNLAKDSLLIRTHHTYSFEAPRLLIQDSTILIDNTAFEKWSNEIFFQGLYNFNAIDDSVIVYDMKGNELIVWTESQRNDPGKQFFNEKYWQKREWKEGKYTYHEWTFELLPEDIKIKEQEEP